MKESYLYKKVKNKTVQCLTCNHYCVLNENQRGKCGVRENIKGKLFALNYGKLIAANIDPIEKKPLFNFLPGTFSYSISTVGCNLFCKFCQNWDISQSPKPPHQGKLGAGQAQNPPVIGEEVKPETVVKEALKTKCQSIAYTYTEPTIFLEFALDTMKLAKKKGLRNVWVSNGFMSKETLKLILPYLDAINVDLKSLSPKYYQEICGARLQPVLDNLKEVHKKKVHLEVTTLIVHTLNDSKKELKEIATFIKKELGKEVPWHISRFFPAYKLSHLESTPIEKISEAYKIGKEEGLEYVYGGNILNKNLESTFCPKCGNILIEREGFDINTAGLEKNICKKCGNKVNIFIKPSVH